MKAIMNGEDQHGAKATTEERASGSFLLVRPAVMLRAEGAVMLAGSALLYWMDGGSWWLFALLLLAPDVSMLGYLAGPRVGAAAYNAFHSYPLPATLAMVGLLVGAPLAVSVALVWFAHIGLDRALGYGLKYRPPSRIRTWGGCEVPVCLGRG